MTDVSYRGWNMGEHIVIVERLENNGYVNKGYIVNVGNKKQLESARNWGRTYTSKENIVTGGRQSVEVAPLEHLYSNKGFKLTIQQAPTHSSQGGKLSFCMCLIEAPDGKKFNIGIDTAILFRILQQSTVVNGVVQEEMSFVRNGTALGMVHKDMIEYKYAEEDKQIKNKMNTKKTNKYIPGHKYLTLTLESIYLGKIYQWAETEVLKKRKGNYGALVPDAYVMTIYDKPKVKHMLLESFYFNREDMKDLKTFDEILEVYRLKVADNISKYKSSNRMSGYGLSDGIDIINSHHSLVDKTPSRVDGGKVLDMENSQENLDKFLTDWREQMINLGKTMKNTNNNLSCEKLFYSGIDKSPFENMTDADYDDIYKLANPSVKFYIQNEKGEILYER